MADSSTFLTTDRRTTLATLLAVALVAGAAAVPVLVDARPANRIPVADATGESLSQPTADAWSDVPTTEVPMASAPSGVPSAGDTSVSSVSVRAAKTDSRLYVRLSWNDTTTDDRVDGPRTFADAAAIQVPVNTSTHPAIAMGSTRSPVNVWYWSSDAGSEELFAGGPGSTTAFDDPALNANAVHRDGRWQVVYARDLAPGGDNRTQIRQRNDLDVAFAVWNGSNAERSGQKAVSEWYHFPLGPEPSGPPFQTMLWAVAGLAIAFVVLVTVMAVRKQENGGGGE